MIKSLIHIQLGITDLHRIKELLLGDERGQTREFKSAELDENYLYALHKIDNHPNQYPMFVERDAESVGSCHLTIMQSLTINSRPRMQTEAVRNLDKYRGQI